MARKEQLAREVRGLRRKVAALDKGRGKGAMHRYHSWSDRPVPEWVVGNLKAAAERGPTHEGMKGAYLSALYLELPQQTGIWGGFPQPAIPVLQSDVEHAAGRLRQLAHLGRLKVLRAVFAEWLEAPEIARAAGLSERSVRSAVRDLLDEGLVACRGERYRASVHGQAMLFNVLHLGGAREPAAPQRPRRKGG